MELNNYQVKLLLAYLNEATDYNEHKAILIGKLEQWLKEKHADDCWGIVRWCDEDIELQLKEHGITPTPGIVDDIRTSSPVRHIQDSMIDDGWNVIDYAISDWVAEQEAKGVDRETLYSNPVQIAN
jgi:hypothetical protein